MPINDAETDSIYKCSSELLNKGYIYEADGLFCPLTNNTYLKISRNKQKYSYAIVEYRNDTFNYLSSAYTCKEAITEDKTSRTNKLEEYWSKTENTTDIKPRLLAIAVDLMNEPNFTQVNETFSVYEEQQKNEVNDHDDLIDKIIENRRHPKLNPIAKKRLFQKLC